VTAGEEVNAKRAPQGRAGALALLKTADTLVAARGKQVTRLDLKKASAEEALALMLGPTGNLRAPTLRKGRTLIVGFDAATYSELLT
jgi:arsenate reductase-like glutaredoxin family protein